MGGGASAVRDPWALVGSHPSAVCVRASVPVTPWETSRIAEKTRAALPDPWSPASITRVAPDRRQQVGTATSRRRNCRLRPPFKGVMRWRMKDPPNLAMRWRIAPSEAQRSEIKRLQQQLDCWKAALEELLRRLAKIIYPIVCL